jgi:hypothetical protein
MAEVERGPAETALLCRAVYRERQRTAWPWAWWHDDEVFRKVASVGVPIVGGDAAEYLRSAYFQDIRLIMSIWEQLAAHAPDIGPAVRALSVHLPVDQAIAWSAWCLWQLALARRDVGCGWGRWRSVPAPRLLAPEVGRAARCWLDDEERRRGRPITGRDVRRWLRELDLQEVPAHLRPGGDPWARPRLHVRLAWGLRPWLPSVRNGRRGPWAYLRPILSGWP